jgi:predicted transcriptional regulator
MREKGIDAIDIAKVLGVSRATVYRYLACDESSARRDGRPPRGGL